MSLPRFTPPIAAEDFLQQYWQKKPLLMPSAASGLSYPSKDQLFTLAQRDDVESRLIQGENQGPWQLSHGPFGADAIKQLPASTWTLLVQSVDYYFTQVSLMLDSFAFLPSWRHEDIMLSYATEGGSVGPHFDRYDVFLIQAQGQRQWHLGPVCNEQSPRQNTEELDLLAEMPIESSHLMSPGDVLYIPPGVSHWGIAQDNDCITWSVGFRAPRLTDLLARLTDETLADNSLALFSDANRATTNEIGILNSADCEQLTTQALSLLNKQASHRAFCEFLTEAKQFPQQTLVESDTIHAAQPDTALVRIGGTRLLASHDGIWINSYFYPLDESLLPFASYLAQHRLYTAAKLKSYMNEEAKELLDEWIAEGFFQYVQ